MKRTKPQTGEQRFLDAWDNSFRQQYSNPGRVGCVSKDILWKMASRPRAFRRDPHAEATLEHICQCSPCMDELSVLRRKAALLQRLRIAAWACSGALLILAVLELFRS